MHKVVITNIKNPSMKWGASFATLEELYSWLEKTHYNKVGRRLEREVKANSEIFDEKDVLSERFDEDNIRYVTLAAEATYEVTDISQQVIQNQANEAALKFLQETDWQTLRHRDQIDLGVSTSLTEQEFQSLLQQRQDARNQIVR